MDKNTTVKHSIGLIGFALFFWLMAEMMNSAVQASEEKCTIIEETDTYIQKNCVNKNGKVISASIESKPMPGITIVKSDEGTPQVKVNVEKFVDETALPEAPIIQVKDGEILPLDVMLPKLIAESDRVQAAKENFKASVEDLKSAKSMYHPNVSITYGHNEESDRTPSQSSGAESISNTNKSGTKASITLTQLIWDGGRTDTAVDIAKRNSQKAQINLELTIEDVIVEGVTVYINMIKNYNTYQANLKIEDNAKKALAMTIEKVKKGEASKMEQLQIEQQFRTYESITTQSKIQYEIAKENFVKVWGFNPPEADKFPMPNEDLLGKLPNNPKNYNGNKSLRMADYDKVIARLTTKNMKNEFKPTIDSTVSYTDYQNDLGGGYGSTKSEWRFDVTMRWTLFNGWKNTSDYKAAKHREQAMELTYKDTAKNINNQVKSLWTNFNNMKKNLKTLERSNKINKEMYALTLQDFKAGNSPLLAVFSMKTAEINSEVAVKNAKLDLLLQRYNIHKLIGSINQ